MLSAVENFGPAAAATRAYVHHHNFSIAAAAAAAGTAAAVEHHHHMLAGHPSLNGAGLLLPSTQLAAALASSDGTTSTISARNLSATSGSLNSKSTNNSSHPSGPTVVTMSSTEFLRPHPKQPRFNGATTGSIAGNLINNPASSNPNSGSSTNGNTNGIPLHARSSKIGSSTLNLSNSPPSRLKYSSEHSGAVNLVTSNNGCNSGGGGGVNSSTPPMKNSPLEAFPPPSRSPSERERDIMAGMYAAQNLAFPSTEATAAAVYQYSRVLAANRSLYGDPSLYVTHPLARGQLISRPTYIPEQFPTYLHPPPNAYSPPGAPTTLLGPPPAPTVTSSQLGSPHSASNLLNNSHNSSPPSASLNITQMPVMSERHPHVVVSSSLHHPSSSHLPQPLITIDRSQAASYPKEKDVKNGNQMNGKVNMLVESQAGFKVPSGKEGSMKHRILTRPQYGDKDVVRHRSPGAAAVFRNSNSTNSPTNFTKGSLIELSTGELRRVEDMRTEDFVQSAERSQHLELADSTVVKILSNSHNVAITFSYNKNRSKVDIDASVEHPFFVYGQGWASCNPDLTLKTFGLKCQRLQVGDVCISLKPRESLSNQSYPSMPHSPTNYSLSSHLYKDDMGPQNLSRKQLTSCNSQTTTTPTTATGTAVSSRLSAAMPPHLPPPTAAMPSHIPGVQAYDMLHAYRTNSPVPSHNSHHISPPAGIPPQHHPHQMHQIHQHQLQRQKIEGHVVLARNGTEHHHHHSSSSSSPPTSTSSNRPPSNQQPFYLGTTMSASDKCNGRESNANSGGAGDSGQLINSDQQAAIDASTARKRRWSWSNPNAKVKTEGDGGDASPKTICNSNC